MRARRTDGQPALLFGLYPRGVARSKTSFPPPTGQARGDAPETAQMRWASPWGRAQDGPDALSGTLAPRLTPPDHWATLFSP